MKTILLAGIAALLLSGCSTDAGSAQEPSGTGGASAGVQQPNQGYQFPTVPARQPVPLVLGDVPGFSALDATDSDEATLRLAVLALGDSWAMGDSTRDCMRAKGFDWDLEVSAQEVVFELGAVLGHFGEDATVDPFLISLPGFDTKANDARLAQWSAARSRQALEALYGNLASLTAAADAFYATSIPGVGGLGQDTVDSYLEPPRISGEALQLMPYAGGCVGAARDALPEFARTPPELAAAFSATYTDPALDPIMGEALVAFDACVREAGVDFPVNPDQLEVLDAVDENVADAVNTNCGTPYRDVEGQLIQLAQDQFVRDNEQYLRAALDAANARYAALGSNADFLAFLHEVAQASAGATA